MQPLSRRLAVSALGLGAWSGLVPRSVGQARADVGAITLPEGRRRLELPFESIDQRMFVAARLSAGDGKQQHTPLDAQLVFDTGGSNILDLTVAQRLQLPLHGRFEMPGAGAATLPAWRTRLPLAELGGLSMRGLEFVVLPLAEIRQAIGLPRLDGLVGRELLGRFVVALDGQRQRIVLHEPSTAPAAGPAEIELPLRWAGNLPAVQGAVDGRPALLALDTGDRSALTLFSPFVDAHGLRAQAGQRQVTGWGVGGPLLADLLRVGRLALGAVAVQQVLSRLPVGAMGVFSSRLADASVGNAVLGRLQPTFDYSRGVVRLAASGDAGPVGQVDGTGMWLRSPDAWAGDFEVHSLRAAGAAARAGLQAGDRVVAINGVASRERVLARWREQLLSARAGTELRVRVLGEPQDRVLTLDATL